MLLAQKTTRDCDSASAATVWMLSDSSLERLAVTKKNYCPKPSSAPWPASEPFVCREPTRPSTWSIAMVGIPSLKVVRWTDGEHSFDRRPRQFASIDPILRRNRPIYFYRSYIISSKDVPVAR